jgi:hypothetical protein
MNIPAYSDNRTDAEIKADSEKDKGLEAGTMRDANGQIRNMRYFPPAPIETYAQYLKRTEGLTDFTPLTEAQYRKETHQLSYEDSILADLGITKLPVLEVKVPLDTPALDGTLPTVLLTQEIDISEYLNVGAPDISTHAAEAEARHNAAHPPVVDSIKLEL